jgi:hypothetical protein
MMGLYLAIFDDGDELDGVEVGAYSDFDTFREAVVDKLENGVAAGSRFPTLILHADCDGQWTPTEAGKLERELAIIRVRFQELPPIALDAGWKKQVAKTFSLQIDNLHDCFFDVDGEPLLERLIDLARLSQAKDLPILFQ